MHFLTHIAPLAILLPFTVSAAAAEDFSECFKACDEKWSDPVLWSKACFVPAEGHYKDFYNCVIDDCGAIDEEAAKENAERICAELDVEPTTTSATAATQSNGPTNTTTTMPSTFETSVTSAVITDPIEASETQISTDPLSTMVTITTPLPTTLPGGDDDVVVGPRTTRKETSELLVDTTTPASSPSPSTPAVPPVQTIDDENAAGRRGVTAVGIMGIAAVVGAALVF